MRNCRRRQVLVFTLLAALLLNFSSRPCLAEQPLSTNARDDLLAVWDLAKTAGSYRFTVDAEQTFIPQSVAGLIGEQETRLDMRFEGQTQLPDRAYLELTIEGSDTDQAPLVLLRDGTNTFIKEDGQLTPVENPAGAAMSTNDFLGYLQAAEQVQRLDDVSDGGQTLRHYSFVVSGPVFAEYVRDYVSEQLGESGNLPDGVQMSASPTLQNMSGTGELWVGEDGLPVRQDITLSLPEVSDSYDARLRILVDFRDYGCEDDLPRAVQNADGSWSVQATAAGS